MAKIKSGDTVFVSSGREKGKQGKVRAVHPKDRRLIIEGVNFVTRHQKGRPGVRQAGIIQQEAALDISNVMLVCGKCGRPTRVGFRFLEDGRKVRACKHCDEVID